MQRDLEGLCRDGKVPWLGRKRKREGGVSSSASTCSDESEFNSELLGWWMKILQFEYESTALLIHFKSN